MAITNQERVGKAMDLLRAGLRRARGPGGREERQPAHGRGAPVCRRPYARSEADRAVGRRRLLKLLWETWNDVFARTLGRAERSLMQELRDWRNKWAHQEPFSSDDADRALDSMTRLLTAVSAPQAYEVGKMKMELRRLIYDAGARRET